MVEKAGDIEVLLQFALDTKLGFDANDVIQKYFINGDQLSLTNQELLRNLKSGASTDVESAREDVLARLKVNKFPKIYSELGQCIYFFTSTKSNTFPPKNSN